MNKRVLLPILLLLSFNTFSQDLNFMVRPVYEHPVAANKLIQAKSMGDIIPNYPGSWIVSYVSAEILVKENGKTLKATSTSDILTNEQRNILRNSGLGTEVIINIEYKYKNSITKNLDVSKLSYSATVVPEVEAEYSSGKEKMNEYVNEHAVSIVSNQINPTTQSIVLIFTINEEGSVVNTKVSNTSGDLLIDNMVIEAINKMPQWKPAESPRGTKVKQEFELSIGAGGC